MYAVPAYLNRLVSMVHSYSKATSTYDTKYSCHIKLALTNICMYTLHTYEVHITQPYSYAVINSLGIGAHVRTHAHARTRTFQFCQQIKTILRNQACWPLASVCMPGLISIKMHTYSR